MDNVHVFSDSDALADALALRWREEAERAVKENRLYTGVLSGGATAAKVYQKLAIPGFGEEIPWESVHLFWTDERCVPPESEESNFGTAYRTFLSSIPIPDENIHRIRGEADPDAESIRYEKEIREHLALRNTKGYFFDWVLLGLGIDGHTASLFPGQEKLMTTSKLCEVAQHPETDEKRITLTPSSILQSAHITYHVSGQQKSEIVSALVLKPTQTKNYPAAHIPGEWYLDEAAASGIRHSEK